MSTLLKSYRDYATPQRYVVQCNVHHGLPIYPLHRHDYIEIEYLESGVMEHELNGVRQVLHAGDCYCLDYAALHRFRVLEPITIHNLCLDYKAVPNVVQRLLHTAVLPCGGRVCAEKQPFLLDSFYHLEAQLQTEENYAEERITAYLLLTITEILASCAPLTERSAPTGYRHIAKAIDYISQNYAEPLTSAQVANGVYLSPNYFCKLFSEISGSTFASYLTQVRLENARRRLRETTQPVTQIALECGFGSFSNFSRAFKHAYGCAPSEYRRWLKL